jgi:hypothetical protein
VEVLSVNPVTRDQLESLEMRLAELKKRYLEEHGWQHTTNCPGGVLLWKKIYRDETYFGSMGLALAIEEALSDK